MGREAARILRNLERVRDAYETEGADVAAGTLVAFEQTLAGLGDGSAWDGDSDQASALWDAWHWLTSRGLGRTIPKPPWLEALPYTTTRPITPLPPIKFKPKPRATPAEATEPPLQ